jgi:hypothetical protein
MYIPVADAHGLVENEILSLVYPLFNIFLIHSFIDEKDMSILKFELNKIKQIHKEPLIFIIYHDENLRDS